MSKIPLRIFVTGIKKKSIQRHPIIMTDADYEYMLDKIERCENSVWTECDC